MGKISDKELRMQVEELTKLVSSLEERMDCNDVTMRKMLEAIKTLGDMIK